LQKHKGSANSLQGDAARTAKMAAIQDLAGPDILAICKLFKGMSWDTKGAAEVSLTPDYAAVKDGRQYNYTIIAFAPINMV
jgi:hypothetical protein